MVWLSLVQFGKECLIKCVLAHIPCTFLALLPVAFFLQNSSLDFYGFLPSEHPGRYNRERDREPYFERQGNSSTDHRDFKRERELHRDRGSVDYERERFDKERHPRDDRYVVLEHYGHQYS